MKTEHTLSMIKPDATARHLTGKILAFFEENGLRIAAQKRLTLSLAEAQAFYQEHAQRPFFGDLTRYMSSGAISVQVLSAVNAVAHHRGLMGATDPAQAEPGTIRALYGQSIEANAVHGSDSPQTAAREIGFFFAARDLLI